MKIDTTIINLNFPNSDVYEIINFSDGHKHFKFSDRFLMDKTFHHIHIKISLRTADDLFLLSQIKYVCDSNPKITLSRVTILYLLAARYDRAMYPGDSFDLLIVTNTINSLNLPNLQIVEPHSNVTTTLLPFAKILKPLDNSLMLNLNKLGYDLKKLHLVAPDLGAIKRVEEFAKSNSLDVPIIKMNKTRNLKTGAITGMEILGEYDFTDSLCVIYDDLCDGGRTFTEAAKLLRYRGSKTVVLAVTHGIFSKGTLELYKHREDGSYLDHIITTNSFKEMESTHYLTVLNI